MQLAIAWVCALSVTLGAASPPQPQATAPAIPDYKVGDQAAEDVIAPERLVVVDPIKTEELRQQAIARVPVVYFHCTNSADEVDARFHLSFQETRTNFLAALRAAYGPGALSADSLRADKFTRLVSEFHRQNRAFPLNTNLFRTWAKGTPDDTIESGWSSMLREQMDRYLRADAWPEAAKPGPAHLLMLEVASPRSPLAPLPLDLLGTNVHRTNLVTLAKSKRDLQGQFTRDQRPTADFLAGFLQPNCLFAEELTQRSRAQRTDPLLAAAEYQPGQAIVKAGQVVDEKARAALDQLRAQLALKKLNTPDTAASQQLQSVNLLSRWLLIATLGLVFVVALVLWRLTRVRRTTSSLPARIHHPGPSPMVAADGGALESTETETGSWRHRALEAEHRADQATKLVKAGLLPHFARWLGDRFVRGLLAQRSEMTTIQEQAARDIEELEARLIRIHAPLTERLNTYEKRITELEQQLAVENAKNRALLQAEIDLIRKKVSAEQTRQRSSLN